MVRLSIVVTTCGRETLDGTLAAIGPQLADVDEVVVVSDRVSQTARSIFNGYAGLRWRYIVRPAPCSWGGYQTNAAHRLCTGTHVARMDDDDRHTADAFEHFRAYACEQPVIFRMRYPTGELCWSEQTMGVGNYGTPCFLTPLVKPMPQYGLRYEGDADFIRAAVGQLGGPVWRPEVVAEIRP